MNTLDKMGLRDLMSAADVANDAWQRMNDLLYKKRVRLIGGCDEDIGESNDAAGRGEVVVRVNSHWKRQRGRCDILFFSCANDLDYSMLEDEELYSTLKLVAVNATPALFGEGGGERVATVLSKMLHRRVPVELYYCAPLPAWSTFVQLKKMISGGHAWSYDLSNRYHFHPLTGMLALHRLTYSGASLIYVEGMNMYQQPSGRLPRTVGAHSLEGQLRYLRDVHDGDSRVILSDGLNKALKAAVQEWGVR